jgi:GNAT superfamily N-acetyltransferase
MLTGHPEMAFLTGTTRSSASDLERLVTLHRSCLPRSILSLLGDRAVTRYYAYVAASSDELVAVARIDGTCEAGCVVSLTPSSLLRRFALHAPTALAAELGRGLLASRELRRRCLLRLSEAPPAGPADLPELVQIFTNAQRRGHGLGAELVRFCEDSLRGLGVAAYTIHTERDDNEAGIRFYRREGFTITGEARSFGDYYVIMKKELR